MLKVPLRVGCILFRMASLKPRFHRHQRTGNWYWPVRLFFLLAGVLTSCGVVISLANSLYAILDRMLNHWLVNANTWVQPASKLEAGIRCAEEDPARTGTEGVCCKHCFRFSAKAREWITLVIWIGSTEEDKTSYS